MGNGIAQAFAVAGHAVTMTDIGQAQVDRGLKTIDGSLERLVKKEKMSAARQGRGARADQDLDRPRCPCQESDIVIEAVTEDLALEKLALEGTRWALPGAPHDLRLEHLFDLDPRSPRRHSALTGSGCTS